jgi:uncharacterized protein
MHSATLRAVTLALTVCFPIIASAQQSAPTDKPKEPTLSVNGTARVERAPDYVDIAFGIIAIEKTATEAQATASRTMEAAIKAVRALSLKDEDLQTGSIELYPQYDDRNDYNEHSAHPTIVGYRATITIRVRTSDLKSVPKVIDAALSAGCNRVDYVQFGIKEAISAREEAIKLAAQAAKRKANVLADALDLRIVRIETASTTSQMGGWYGGYRYGMPQMAQMSNRMEGGGAQDGESPVVPGKVEVWADTNITFIAAPRDADVKR